MRSMSQLIGTAKYCVVSAFLSMCAKMNASVGFSANSHAKIIGTYLVAPLIRTPIRNTLCVVFTA